MRCFIAIDLENDYFKELQSQIKDIKGTFPKSFHLTLKFLGEVEENKADKIKELLRKIRFEQFNIYSSNIGFFPNENYIRVVWVGLEPRDRIIELQKKIDNELLKLFPKEKKFEPHITLARIKYIKDKGKFKELVKNIKVEKIEFKVDNFKLMKSTLTKQGPIYEVIETFKSS